MKKYKIKPTEKQIEIMKVWWKAMCHAQNLFYNKLSYLESQMSKETGIKDLEFFWCDNSIVGVGNVDRTLKLIQQEKLEDV